MHLDEIKICIQDRVTSLKLTMNHAYVYKNYIGVSIIVIEGFHRINTVPLLPAGQNHRILSLPVAS